MRYHNKETGKRVAENIVVMENIFYQRNITLTFDLKGSSRARYVEVYPDQRLNSFDEALQKRRKERQTYLSTVDPRTRETCYKAKKILTRRLRKSRGRQLSKYPFAKTSRRDEILECLKEALGNGKFHGDGDGMAAVVVGEEDVEAFMKYESQSSSQQPMKVHQTLLDDNLMELTRGRPFPLKQRAKLVFQKAVSNDTMFLSIVNVVDYSILVGFDEDSHEIVVGIIDYLRQYDIVKRMERMGKSVGMFAGQAEPTIIQPSHYRRRFSSAMERYFMTVPDKWIAHDSQ